MAIQVSSNGRSGRWTMVAVLAGVALFGSYAFAQAKGSGATGGGDILSSVVAAATTGGAGGGGMGCCGSGAAAPASAQIPKAAELKNGIQTIGVDASQGYYDPSTIELKAGVPAEITFSQAGGCMGSVQSQDLGFYEDLSGGPKTVKLDGLQPGTYSFACGMNMIPGSIVVK